ncbi:MAG: hypothetical protein NT077_03310 [Candidatus Taylorbacteria bacterium]|nr:hypothetical protein [Candidatus Taylorbacteria bacterium]
MDIVVLVAKIMGIYLVVSGLFLLIRGKTIPHMLKDFFDHPATIYLTGIILVFLSSIYLIQYNIWDGTWRVVVTIFVWLVILKGLAYIFIPQAMNEVAVKKFRSWFSLYGIVAIVIGFCLFFLN